VESRHWTTLNMKCLTEIVKFERFWNEPVEVVNNTAITNDAVLLFNIKTRKGKGVK
jgi:hypothetical protein